MTTPDLLFLTTLAFLFNHELDAIRQHEWRFFFSWTGMSNEWGYRLFVILHAPLFIWIVAVWQDVTFQRGFALFAIAHVFAHIILYRYVDFKSMFSWFWIGGTGVMGIAYLLLT